MVLNYKRLGFTNRVLMEYVQIHAFMLHTFI